MPYRNGSKTSIKAFFGDAEYAFDLVDPEWKYLMQLEEKVGSLLNYFSRLRLGDFRVMQLRDTIRLGLIGGGATPRDAENLCKTYFDATPIHEHLAIALSLTAAAMFGTDEDGKVLSDETPAEEATDDPA